MKTIIKTAQAGCAGQAIMALAACSGEPGANDMKQAIRNNNVLMMQLQTLARMGGGGDVNQILDTSTIEKGSCASASGSPGFICDFRLNANGQAGQWGKARFYNAGGWQMEVIR